MNGKSAMVSVQLREPPAEALALRVTCPLPVPFVGETVSQSGHGFTTVQAQLAGPCTVTFTLVLLPLASSVAFVGESE